MHIIAHSMGGLLVKKYLSSLADTGFVDKLILVGVPELGAPQAFKVLNYGDDEGIPILNNAEVKRISQNMPSVYELLPSRQYTQLLGGYVQDLRKGARTLTYDETTALMTGSPNDSRNKSMFPLAENFHRQLDPFPVHAGDIYNIVGCLNPTPAVFQVGDEGSLDMLRSNGDGTVPVVSAMGIPNARNNYFVLNNETGIDHMGLVSDVRPLALMTSIVAGTASTSSLPQGISSLVGDCSIPRLQITNETTIEFSTHSPVALHVYDAKGKHTGPLANGEVDIGIPGSTYETIGENTFITVPGGGNYKVVDQGLSPGSFTMKVKGYKGSVIDHEMDYPNVSLRSSSTVATLNFSGFAGVMDLKLDKNGDGIVDSVIQPSMVSFGVSRCEKSIGYNKKDDDHDEKNDKDSSSCD